MSKRRGDQHLPAEAAGKRSVSSGSVSGGLDRCQLDSGTQLPALTTSGSFGEQIAAKRFGVKESDDDRRGRRMSDEVEITNHRADATQNESLIGLARMGADGPSPTPSSLSAAM